MNASSTIAAAVKTALAGASPLNGVDFAPKRLFVPADYDTAGTSELRMTVVAFEEDVDLRSENATRAECDHLYPVKIAIEKRIEAPDVTSEDALEELDALSDFREAVILFLKAPANRMMANARLDTLTNPTIYDPDSLDQKKIFVSVIVGKYRMLR